MDTPVKVAAWLWIIFGAFGVIGAICFGAMVPTGGIISQDETAITVTSIIGGVCGSFFLIEAVLELVAGIGLFRFKSWARILAIIVGILNLFAFPLIFPALLGGYTLWLMFNREVKQLFEAEV
jgi:hypothetical protein